MTNCTIEGCTRKAKYRSTGWCQTHYHRYWRTGTTDLMPKPLLDDKPTYRAAHSRCSQLWGKASLFQCVACGFEADEWAYDGTDPNSLQGVASGYPISYSAWPEFYMPMCHGCHRARDAGARSEARTHFGCGHARNKENSYAPPSKPRAPECRVCRKEKARVRYLERR